jgi:hypothetical protein
VCVCVFIHLCCQLNLLVSSFAACAMAIYCRIRRKGPPLLSANMKQTLRTLRAARGVKPDTLCGARCSATLECFSSMNIVRCRNRCVTSCFECCGKILGDHNCNTIHDFPDFVAVKPNVFDDSWMISSNATSRPTEWKWQQYYQIGP